MVNTVLWALQVILALKFLSVTYTHGLRPDPAKMERGTKRLGAVARPLLSFTALCTFMAGVGIVLPAALGVWTWSTPSSAALLALLMLPAIGFHVGCRERANVLVSLVLLALAGFVAYGRWVLAPL